MKLGGAGVKRFYNPVKLNFTEWGNWEAIILEAVGNRKALLMTVRREGGREGGAVVGGMCSGNGVKWDGASRRLPQRLAVCLDKGL
jgi:hypothetical protein